MTATTPQPEDKPARRPTLEPDREPLSGPARAFAIAGKRAAYWVSRHWLFLFSFFIAIYIALPFLAPILMTQGYTKPANLLYTIYSPTCHQLGFRSWFIDGEQGYYPLEETGISHVHYFQEYEDNIQTQLKDKNYPDITQLELPAEFGRYIVPAAKMVGDQQMGYKVALCQRDVAMYLSILLGGMLFGLFRQRIKPLRWQLFVLLGVLPMLIDGGYQLVTWQLGVLAHTPINAQWLSPENVEWLNNTLNSLSQTFPPHETLPLFRVITGALFGLGLVWMTYPHIHEGMQETEDDLREDLIRAQIIQAPE